MPKKHPQSPKTTSLHIGRTVRMLREETGLTGSELCRRSGGLDPKTLTAVEKGRIRNPSVQTLEWIAKGLDTTISAIFRQAELGSEKHFLCGGQKGVFQMQVQNGIELVSFTPFAPGLFCGKFIVGGRKTFDSSQIRFEGTVFAMALTGSFRARMENREFELSEGENVYFRGAFEFAFHNPAYRNASLLVVSSPSFLASRAH